MSLTFHVQEEAYVILLPLLFIYVISWGHTLDLVLHKG